MQKKINVLLIITTLLCTQAFSQVIPEVNEYKVKKGDTLFKIAQQHKVTVTEIKALNPAIKNDNLSLDQALKIPKKNPIATVKLEPTLKTTDNFKAQVPKPTQLQPVADKSAAPPLPKNTLPPTDSVPQTPKPKTVAVPIRHLIQSGETLEMLHKTYGSTPQQLKEWNKLAKDSLLQGQDLIIKWLGDSIPAITATPKPTTINAFQKKYNDLEAKSTKPIKEEGIATFFDDSGEGNGSNMYALHKTAPISSVLKVTNTINNKSIYVKVMGRLPNTVNNEKVILSLAQSAARQINLLDAKTMVKCSYYKTTK